MSHKKSDLESQSATATAEAGPVALDSNEYAVSTSKKLSYLAIYFLCNVSLTIYNKLVLGKVSFLSRLYGRP